MKRDAIEYLNNWKNKPRSPRRKSSRTESLPDGQSGHFENFDDMPDIVHSKFYPKDSHTFVANYFQA